MYCINCGSEIIQGAKFCFNCGSKLDELLAMKGSRCEGNSSTVMNLNDASCGEKSYWSSMYGEYQYIEYKGNIYCVVPTFDVLGYNDNNCTNEDCLGSGKNRKWSIVRFSKDTNTFEVIKEINENVVKEGYGFGQSVRQRGITISFIIYDDKMYYYQCDCTGEDTYANIICLDINTREEYVTRRILVGDIESRFYGFLKGNFGEVSIYSEYDEEGGEILFISNMNADTEQKKMLGNKTKIYLEAYNEQYLYYKLENKLHVLDLNSFEISDLSTELTMIDDFDFYINPIKNVINVLDDSGDNLKIVSLDLHNEIIEELRVPELPACVERRFINFKRDSSDGGVFYNGEYLIVKINPENVDVSTLCGIMIFDKNGNKIGEWLNEKNNHYIARNRVRFSLPSALSVSYEIVDKNGTQVDFVAGLQGRKEWHERIIYLQEDNIIDSKLDFCSYCGV